MTELTSAVFDGASAAVTLCLKLLGALCLWCGLMQIAEKSGLCNVISSMLTPVLSVLFPRYRNNKHILQAISMNMSANLLGLGNAATPLGIEAVRRMQELNNDKESATHEMMVFVVINTAALKIIPSTVAALRQAAGSVAPMDIIVCMWISSALSQFAAVGAVKLVGRFVRK